MTLSRSILWRLFICTRTTTDPSPNDDYFATYIALPSDLYWSFHEAILVIAVTYIASPADQYSFSRPHQAQLRATSAERHYPLLRKEGTTTKQAH